MIQNILISVITGVAVGVPIALLKTFLAHKIMKYILGLPLTIGLFGLGFWLLLVNAALLGPEKSNEWAVSYISSFLLDVFFS